MFGTTTPTLRNAKPARRQPAAGFTLVELLTVIVIIAILAAITLNISKLILRKQSEARARSEMLTIVSALEAFRGQNGDEYPPMENSQGPGSPYAERNLFSALYGHARWTVDTQNGQPKWEMVPMGRAWADGGSVPNSNGKYTWGHEYIEPSKFTFDKDDSTVSHIKDDAVLYDPWWDGTENHNAYLYRYKTLNDVVNTKPASRNWQAKQYLLITRGPDGLPETPDDNFPMKTVNGHTQNSGFVVDDYGDPAAHPGLADNIVMGSATLPPQ